MNNPGITVQKGAPVAANNGMCIAAKRLCDRMIAAIPHVVGGQWHFVALARFAERQRHETGSPQVAPCQAFRQTTCQSVDLATDTILGRPTIVWPPRDLRSCSTRAVSPRSQSAPVARIQSTRYRTAADRRCEQELDRRRSREWQDLQRETAESSRRSPPEAGSNYVAERYKIR